MSDGIQRYIYVVRESQDADLPLFCSVCSKKEELSYYSHKHFHLISHDGLGFRAAVITLTRWPVALLQKMKPTDKQNVFFEGFQQKIHISLVVALYLHSCQQLMFFFFCCSLDSLKLKIISLLNCAVLVEDTLSSVQSNLKWAFRVVVLMLLEFKKTTL